MNAVFPQSIARYFFILGAVAFIFMSFLGLSHMLMDRHGEMMNCPFMSTTVLCQMTPLQHLSAWQNMFTQVSIKEISNPFILILLSFLLATLFRNFLYEFNFSLKQNLYFKTKTILVFIPNLLKEAFSNGILNPKVY